VAYVALVLYASLHPFGPWSWPAGASWTELLALPWPRYWLALDLWANALGYVPLGFLSVVVVWRRGGGWALAGAFGVLAPSALAYAMEVVQHGLPSRVPSLADWALNSVGAVLGAAAAWALGVRGELHRATRWRQRWFVPHAAGALALWALWPLGLLFPAPVPMAQGQFWPEAWAWINGLLQDRGWPLLPGWGLTPVPEAWAPAVTALGLLAPCGLVLATARRGWHRAVLVTLTVALGVGASGLAAAWVHGPDKTWSWVSPATGPALLAAGALAMVLSVLPARWNALLGVLWLALLLGLVNRWAGDPFLDASLRAWLGGTQVRLYGVLQWLGRLWPLFALAWLLASLTQRPEGARRAP
jgi:VanZ family protein